MSLFKRGNIWWYEFWFAGRRIQESSKSTSKTIAKQAEQQRKRELELGFNAIEDARERNVLTLRDKATEYLESYGLRNRSTTFADYAIRHLLEFLGARMLVDIDETAVRAYQDARLKQKAAPKTINEEVGFLLRLLGDRGEVIRTAEAAKSPEVKGPQQYRESLFARREGGVACRGEEIQVSEYLSGVNACPERGYAKSGNQNDAVEADRFSEEVPGGR